MGKMNLNPAIKIFDLFNTVEKVYFVDCKSFHQCITGQKFCLLYLNPKMTYVAYRRSPHYVQNLCSGFWPKQQFFSSVPQKSSLLTMVALPVHVVASLHVVWASPVLLFIVTLVKFFTL